MTAETWPIIHDPSPKHVSPKAVYAIALCSIWHTDPPLLYFLEEMQKRDHGYTKNNVYWCTYGSYNKDKAQPKAVYVIAVCSIWHIDPSLLYLSEGMPKRDHGYTKNKVHWCTSSSGTSGAPSGANDDRGWISHMYLYHLQAKLWDMRHIGIRTHARM